MTSDLQHQAKRLADDAEKYLKAMHADKCDPDRWYSIRVETAIGAVRRALSPKEPTLWIAVNANNVPDLATLHVDETGCLQTMDEIGLMGFEPRRCTLAILSPKEPTE